MRIRYPKLSNMTHALSLNVFIAFKGTNFSILISNVHNDNKIVKYRTVV